MFVFASVRVFGQVDFIEIRGLGIVKVVPDQIYLRIRLAEKEKYATDLAVKERRMLAELDRSGVAQKDIVIKDMASNFRSPIFTYTGLVLSKEYIVCLYDIKSANLVIEALDKLKISDVWVDHLDHENLEDLKKECYVKAMLDAKSKAETLSGAINQSIGKALHIEEEPKASEAKADRTNVVYKAELAASREWLASSLAYDEIRLECTVIARFELQEAPRK